MFKRWRLLSILFMLVGAANLTRAWTTVYIAPALADREMSLPLPLLGGFYLLCGIGFIIAGGICWWRKTRRRALVIAAIYQAALWALNLSAYRSEYARSLWPRDALLTFCFLALVAILAHEWKGTGTRNHQS